MVNCHHEEALNYKFKHERANNSLSHADQWLSALSTQVTKLQSRKLVWSQTTNVSMFSLTIEVDIESTNRAYIASILTSKCHFNCLHHAIHIVFSFWHFYHGKVIHSKIIERISTRKAKTNCKIPFCVNFCPIM